MKIEFRVIDHNKQRYNTVGDWQYDKESDTLFIDVSKLHVDRFEFLVMIHELIEGYLCLNSGISQEHVDKFDMNYAGNEEEPGDDPRAVYNQQHGVASSIERLLAAVMGVDWPFFNAVVKKMGEEYVPHKELRGHTVQCVKATNVVTCLKCGWKIIGTDYTNSRRLGALHLFDTRPKHGVELEIDEEQAREEIMKETFDDVDEDSTKMGDEYDPPPKGSSEKAP